MPDWDLFWDKRTSSEKLLNTGGVFFNRLFARHIAHFIGPPHFCGEILEVGTGRGVCSATLKKMGYNCVSIDISEFAVKLARGEGLDTLIADGAYLPFGTQTFEVAFTQGLLEHIPLDKQIPILKDMRRVAHKTIHSVPAKHGVMDIGEGVYTRLGKKWPYPDEKKYEKSEFTDLLLTVYTTVKVKNYLNVDWIGYCQ